MCKITVRKLVFKEYYLKQLKILLIVISKARFQFRSYFFSNLTLLCYKSKRERSRETLNEIIQHPPPDNEKRMIADFRPNKVLLQ